MFARPVSCGPLVSSLRIGHHLQRRSPQAAPYSSPSRLPLPTFLLLPQTSFAAPKSGPLQQKHPVHNVRVALEPLAHLPVRRVADLPIAPLRFHKTSTPDPAQADAERPP